MKSTYDIIIVGGGIVGATLACALAKQTSLSIAIFEAKSTIHAWTPTHYHHRVSAIALSSQRIFAALQVWQTMQTMRVSPFTKMVVWDDKGKGEIHFDSADIAESVLGYIIENNVMQNALHEKIKQYPQIDYISPVQLKALHVYEDKVTLIADDEEITAKLVIGADGAHSWVRRQAEIVIDQHHYNQAAIVATVHTALSHEQTARQVFLETGPLAFLPLADLHTSSIVWSLPIELAQELFQLEADAFKTKLAEAFSHTLGEIVTVEERHVFPLQKQQVQHYVKSRIALVGDAAHTIHPLAGQGVNMGLLDAMSLVEVMVEALREQRDFASLATLRHYERWRKADNLAMMAGVDMIKNLFASKHKVIQTLRSQGLNASNQMRWLKNIFMRHACGNRGGLPVSM